MHGRLLALGVMCAAALLPLHPAKAAIVSHTNVESFLLGKSDGLAVPIIERDIAATGARNGGVMVVPQPGAAILSDDMNYADQSAAEAAGWYFKLDSDPAIPAIPASSVSFTAQPGSMRLSIGRPQDFFNTNIGGQSWPVIAARTEAVTGDFMVEAKMTFAEPRQRERVHGIIICTYGDEFSPITVNSNLRYIAVGPDGPGSLGTAARTYATGTGEFPWNLLNGVHNQTSYIVRVVKRGQYYYSFARTSETDPWIFQQWFKASEALDGDASRPLAVGIYAKSFGEKNAVDDIQNLDVEYFRVNRIQPNYVGEYTNVMDAGRSAHWRTLSLTTQSMQGLKYQLRTGNTLADGTLTDAGPFVGPDGTAATYFEEEFHNAIPNPAGKRYLEYKLRLDQTPANLPASLLNITADYDPAGLKAVIASSQADWGADGAGVAVQPGGGDLSVARTQVLLEDFSTTTLGPEWTFREGNPAAAELGAYNLTERPGYLRLKVSYPQDLFVGDNDAGGVAVMRELPSGLTNYEVETEVNMELQQNRAAGLHLWLDTNNFAGITVARRNYFEYAIGMLGDVVLNNGVGLAPITFYGSNTMQLRMAKVGNIITASYRDAASPSPGWHVLYTYDAAKKATGGVDFAPNKVALLSKSYNEAVRDTVNVDYNYLKISSLATTGSKSFNLTLPAGSKPDALALYGEGVPAAAVRFQVNNTGPDGTAATFFTGDEPKLPASLAGVTNAEVTVHMDATKDSGVPYLHALALTYTTGPNAVARDSNRADFEAGTVKVGVDTATTPGVMVPVLNFGTPNLQNFDSQPANYLLSNKNLAGRPQASASYPSGNARLTVPRPVDTWGARNAVDKERAFLYEDQLYSGDYEVETVLNFAETPSERRHGGIGLVAPRTAGTTPDDKLNMENVLIFGPYLNPTMDVRFMRGENNIYGDGYGSLAWSGSKMYLRVRKLGNTFVGYVKANEADPWTQVTSVTHANLGQAYIGFMAKSWTDAPADIQNYDYDYLKITPISTTGKFESRALDLGASGLFPWVSTLGGNAASVQVQWRAANSEAALASLPYVGPDGTSATTFSGTYQGFLPASLHKQRYYQYNLTLPVNSTMSDIAVIGLTAGPPSPMDNAISALRIAAGLDAVSADQMNALDIVKGDSEGKVELVDAVAAARAVSGL